MKRIAALIIFCLLSLILAATATAARKSTKKSVAPKESTEEATPYTILSIIPSQGEPGRHVTLMGAGFTADTSVFLGNSPITAAITSTERIDFTIPRLEPGLYALFLKRSDGAVSKSYNFPVIAPKPVVSGLTPDTVQACASDRERTVSISGRNFQENSLVLFDGAAIRSTFNSPESLSFITPQNVFGGQHNIQVRNSDDAVSGTIAFFLSMKPAISAIYQGEDRVNYYELILEGHNFQQGSTVVVDGRQIYNGSDRDRTRFVNCNRIIYERYPYDRTPKSIRIQVMNPGGEESGVATVTAP